MPTGGGKILLFTYISKCIAGVVIFVTPLLALGSDKFCKLLKRTAGNLTISSIHLDEASTSDISKMQAFLSQYKGNGNFFIFTPPAAPHRSQCRKSLSSMFIACQLIRFVVVDKNHLVSHYGMSFRKEFSLLGRFFFRNLSDVFHASSWMLCAMSQSRHLLNRSLGWRLISIIRW